MRLAIGLIVGAGLASGHAAVAAFLCSWRRIRYYAAEKKEHPERMPHPLDTQISSTEQVTKARNLSVHTILPAIELRWPG
jgi:hypothetical protein